MTTRFSGLPRHLKASTEKKLFSKRSMVVCPSKKIFLLAIHKKTPKIEPKKDGRTIFFIFSTRESFFPAGLADDSMMLFHARLENQCGSTDQVAWLNPRFLVS